MQFSSFLDIKRACNRSLLVYNFGYRQVTYTHNKHRTVHAHERELSFCLSSCVENWRYSVVENKSIKAQYPKSIERKRLVKDFEASLSFKSHCGKQVL